MREPVPAGWKGRDRTRALRALAAWLFTVGCAAGAWMLAGGAAGGQDAPGGPAVGADRGDTVYQQTCSMCHGPDGAGGSGQGVAAGPPLLGLDVAYLDLVMRTGRMPIYEPTVGAAVQRLDSEQRDAALTWMRTAFGLRGELPDVADGDAGRGQELYTLHCAACHGSLGEGGVAGDGTLVRGLLGLDRVALVEALRVGPFGMPAFDERVITDDEAADVAAYVDEELSSPATTPLGISEMNRVTMWAMAWLLLLAVVAVTFLVARPPSLPLRRDGDAPGTRKEPRR